MRFLLDLQTLDVRSDGESGIPLLSTYSASLCLSTTSATIC